MDPDQIPSVRCFGSDVAGPARSAFLVVVLANEEMSEVFGKLTCRFDRLTRTLSVAEGYVVERWRHAAMFEDMLAAAVDKCAARHVVVEDGVNETHWAKIFGREVAGARVFGALRTHAAAASAAQLRCVPH